MPRDETILSENTFEAFVAAFERSGFHGANAWHLNDADNLAFAIEAPNFGRIDVASLFIHARWDTVCDTIHSALADPMREDCTTLTEVTIDAGHMVMLEQPATLNGVIDLWLSENRPSGAS